MAQRRGAVSQPGTSLAWNSSWSSIGHGRIARHREPGVIHLAAVASDTMIPVLPRQQPRGALTLTKCTYPYPLKPFSSLTSFRSLVLGSYSEPHSTEFKPCMRGCCQRWRRCRKEPYNRSTSPDNWWRFFPCCSFSGRSLTGPPSCTWADPKGHQN